VTAARLLLLFAAAAALCPAQPPLKPGRKYTTLERLEPARLAAVKAAREALARQRKPSPEVGVYRAWRAAVHVHAEDAKHTLGTRAQVLEAAKATGTEVVLFSDHGGPHAETWHGERDGVLFIKGAEHGDRHELVFPEPAPGLRFHSHVEGQMDASPDGWDGMEIYNRHTDALDDTDLLEWLRFSTLDGERMRRLAALAREYPDEVYGAGADYWPDIFARWDRILATRRFPGLSANDAHQNQLLPDGAGGRFLLDPYAVAFRNNATSILARERTPAAILDSMRAGRMYVAHDWLCDSRGFAFVAINSLGLYQMGDGVPLASTTRATVRTPVPALLKIIYNGEVIAEQSAATELAAPMSKPGAYRAEAWLEIDGELRPWIYANPIYAEPVGLAALSQLPSQALADNVEAVPDLLFVNGEPVEADKQKLDIYRPRGARNRPVLIFYHGGAWVRGDRKQYPFLGNRFAREGYVVVVPSYRLAPKHPHPAQAEDAAAALAWVVRHIEEYGGDPKHITLAGHSAGGHLASLLVTNEQWLRAHGLDATAVRAVAALSAPLDLVPLAGGSSRVFGSDPKVLHAASPQRHVRAALPPFVVTYCQWDYALLPQQAEAFHAALIAAGARSQLVYVPGENHISEITSITREGDATARALLALLAPEGVTP
jgi:acetyl esterase/lipase